MCPRCGAPVADQRWGQPPTAPAGGFGQAQGGAGGAIWQSPQPGQPPRFSAGDLISEDNLPGWMRQGPDGQGGWPPAVQPQQPPSPPQGPVGPGWGQGPGGWQGAPLESQQTVRQPAVGGLGMGPSGTAAPQGYQTYGWQPAPPPPSPQPNYDQRFGPPQVAGGYPGYPNAGYPNGAPMPPPRPAPYQQGAYQQPAPPSFLGGAQPGYVPPSAFPPVEQAGMYGAPGVAGQGSMPHWLAGLAPQPQAPGSALGMQARSLVDEQALPEWLRQQPEAQPRPAVAGWLGASPAEEPSPAWGAPGFPGAASGPGPMGAFSGAPLMSGAPLGGFGPQAPGQGAPGGWQGGPVGPGGQPISEDLALPGWLQAQAGGASYPAQGPYPWRGNEEPVQAAPEAPTSAFAGGMDASPTMRTPNAPTWGAEPEADDAGMDGMDGNQGWNAPDRWDDGPPDAAQSDWGENGGHHAPRGAPLTVDEMPPWLRQSAGPGAARSGAGAERPERGRMAYADDDSRRGDERGETGAWRDERDWDDGDGGWDDRGGGFDDRREAGWGNDYDASSDQSSYDAWGASARGRDRRDAYEGPSPRDNGWGGGEPYSTGYGESANPFANQGNGFDGRPPRGSYDPYPEDDYYGAGGDYDDDYDDQPRRRKGWKGFFGRGE
jgi:hypothetical protein